MTNLGASFRKAREAKGIPLEQIAIETRISTRFLRAIENEEFHLLPGGIFNRGFIRAYAERVGLDGDEAVADYVRLTQFGEPEQSSEPVSPPEPAKKRHRPYSIVAAIVGLLVLVVIFYAVTRGGPQAVVTADQPPVTPVSTAPAPSPEPAASPAAAPEVVTAEAAVPEPTPTPVDPLALEIEASETTWIKIVADGNAVVPGEILERGATRKITAKNSIYLAVGNAAGLNLKINERAAKPLGRSGQVRQVTITIDNLQEFLS